MAGKFESQNWVQWLGDKPTSTDPDWAEFVREQQRTDTVAHLLIGKDAYWTKTYDGYLLAIPENTTDVTPDELQAVLNDWGVEQVKIGELIDKADPTKRDLGITISHEDHAVIEAQRDYLRGQFKG